MPKTLQEITDAWGTWMNGQYPPQFTLPFGNPDIRFTESTNYGKHGELNDYHSRQVSATHQSMTYDPQAPAPIPGTAASVMTSYNNDSSVNQSYTYQQALETQQSFTWSITESLSVGVEISATEGAPGVAQVGEKVTTTLSFSSTQGATSSKKQSWSVSQPIIAPPSSHVDATMVVTTQEYDINWKATCRLAGSVAIWFNGKAALNPGDYHWLWFIPIEQVFAQCQQNNLIDTTGYQIVAGGVLAYSSGTFRGGQGVGVTISVTQKPLQVTNAVASAAEPVVRYTIPINEAGTSALIRGV